MSIDGYTASPLLGMFHHPAGKAEGADGEERWKTCFGGTPVEERVRMFFARWKHLSHALYGRKKSSEACNHVIPPNNKFAVGCDHHEKLFPPQPSSDGRGS